MHNAALLTKQQPSRGPSGRFVVVVGGCFCVLKQRGCRTHDMNLDQTDKLNKDMHMGLGQHTQPITLLCAEIKFSD